jgi:hypothetical protein
MIHRSLRRLGGATAVAAAFILAGGGTALAHECYNTSASDKGNAAKAEHSQNWSALPTQFLIEDVLADIGGTADQQNCFADGVQAALGDTVTLGTGPAQGTDFVIAFRSPSTADGHGIDHLFPVLVGIAEGCGYVLDF